MDTFRLILRLGRFGAVGRSSFAMTFTQTDLLLPLFFRFFFIIVFLFFCFFVFQCLSCFFCVGDGSVGVHRAPLGESSTWQSHNSRSVYIYVARSSRSKTPFGSAIQFFFSSFFLGHNFDSVYYCKNSKRTIIEEIDSETPYSLFLFLSHFLFYNKYIGEEGGLLQDAVGLL